MKNKLSIHPIVLVLLFGAFITGCKPSGDNKDASSSKEIDQQIDQAQSTVTQASDEFATYGYAQRQAFITKMEQLSTDLTGQLNEISESVAKSSATVKTDAEPRIAALQTQRDLIVKQLEAIKKADASTWELTKAATAKAYDDFKSGITATRKWLSEAIAP